MKLWDKTVSKAKVRLYMDQPLEKGCHITPSSDDAHYMLKVMRMGVGDHVALFNGKDGEWLTTITAATKKSLTLTVDEQLRPQQNGLDVWLVFAPIKKARLDFIAQKATELGVSGIRPVMTRRTNVGRLKDERIWANAKEAAEQCERLTVPEVMPSCSLEELIAEWDPSRKLMFCDEELSGLAAHDALGQVARKGLAGPWAILIGPEGGFDDEERALIRKQSFAVPVHLGPRILRADTAAIAALSIWQVALGDW